MCNNEVSNGGDGHYLAKPYECEFMRPGDLLYRVDYEFQLLEEYVILDEKEELELGMYFLAKPVYADDSRVDAVAFPLADDGEWFLTASEAAHELSIYLVDLCKQYMRTCSDILACKDKNNFETLIYRARYK
jgi:hypothetical protein